MLIAAENPRGALKSLDKYNLKRFFEQYKILDPTVIESKVKRKISLSSVNNKRDLPEMPYKSDDVFNKNGGSVFPGSEKKEHVLVIDRFVPTYDKDSGSLRMYTFLQILIDLGYNVTFLPDDLQKREPYVEDLQKMGIDVLYGNMNIEKYLESMGNVFSFVILSRPEQAFKYVSLVRAYAVNSSIIYDTVDLHWLRFERAAAISGNSEFFDKARHFKTMELFNASCSDLVLTVTGDEKGFLLKENPDLKIEVVPNIHDIRKEIKPFGERKDIMFIGGFLHQPNEDAVFYFVKEIFPLVKKSVPEMKFYVVGSDPSEALQKLDSEDVKVTGYVKDIMPYFENCRVFVSPLRYGAGMKGKIGQSMGYGLPVITTVIGAEGIGLIDGENAIIADRPEDFADSIIRLYTDEKLWERLSANSIGLIENNYSREVVSRKISELLNTYKYQVV